jgi:hypothetical protein
MAKPDIGLYSSAQTPHDSFRAACRSYGAPTAGIYKRGNAPTVQSRVVSMFDMFVWGQTNDDPETHHGSFPRLVEATVDL